MDERSSIISLETARNGSTVPVINGIYLHSIYDPEKEAEAFVETFEKQLTHKNHVLILGLGFGYHIKSTCEVLRQKHGKFHITVLEPNKDLINIVEAHKNFSEDEVTIYELKDNLSLYKNESFIKFLLQKPCLLKHEASFSLSKEKFSSFLTYKSDKRLKNFESQISEATKDLLAPDLNSSFLDNVQKIKLQSNISSRAEYLNLALEQVLKKSNGETL